MNYFKLINELDKLCINSVIISSRENIGYLSGFWGSFGFLYISKTRKILFTDLRYIEAAKKTVSDFEIIPVSGNIIVNIAKIIDEQNDKNVGFEDFHISVNYFEEIKKETKGVNFSGIGKVVENLRAIKEKDEILNIKTAAEIADFAFEKILNKIKIGITEKEVAAELEYIMKKNGGEGTSFDTIAISGKKTSLPHGTPSDKKLLAGDLLLLDFGCVYNNYSSDMTRTIAIGKISEKQKTVYEIVLKAQIEALNNAFCGAMAKDVDFIARNIIEKEGYGNFFVHSLGHGVGINVHEMPRLSTKSEDTLKEGMIVTIEPGIYIENEFGTRIEDLILITKNGYECFTKSPKELIIS